MTTTVEWVGGEEEADAILLEEIGRVTRGLLDAGVWAGDGTMLKTRLERRVARELCALDPFLGRIRSRSGFLAYKATLEPNRREKREVTAVALAAIEWHLRRMDGASVSGT